MKIRLILFTLKHKTVNILYIIYIYPTSIQIRIYFSSLTFVIVSVEGDRTDGH